MNKLQDSYFGNYRGIVKQHGVNGLCKIYFPGVYPKEYEKNISKLPWAEPAMPLTGGGSILNGTLMYPDLESTVWAFFESGNINMPVFFAQTNNDKTQFSTGELVIKYNNLLIKLDSNNNAIDITNSGYDGSITLNGDIITLNSQKLNIANDQTELNITYKCDIISPSVKVTGSLGCSVGATGVNKVGNQFSEGICTKI